MGSARAHHPLDARSVAGLPDARPLPDGAPLHRRRAARPAPGRLDRPRVPGARPSDPPARSRPGRQIPRRRPGSRRRPLPGALRLHVGKPRRRPRRRGGAWPRDLVLRPSAGAPAAAPRGIRLPPRAKRRPDRLRRRVRPRQPARPLVQRLLRVPGRRVRLCVRPDGPRSSGRSSGRATSPSTRTRSAGRTRRPSRRVRSGSTGSSASRPTHRRSRRSSDGKRRSRPRDRDGEPPRQRFAGSPPPGSTSTSLRRRPHAGVRSRSTPPGSRSSAGGWRQVCRPRRSAASARCGWHARSGSRPAPFRRAWPARSSASPPSWTSFPASPGSGRTSGPRSGNSWS